MTQFDLDRQVARATGESLKTIAGRGFSLMEPDRNDFYTDPDDQKPRIVDWDELDARRQIHFDTRRASRLAAGAA